MENKCYIVGTGQPNNDPRYSQIYCVVINPRRAMVKAFELFFGNVICTNYVCSEIDFLKDEYKKIKNISNDNEMLEENLLYNLLKKLRKMKLHETYNGNDLTLINFFKMIHELPIKLSNKNFNGITYEIFKDHDILFVHKSIFDMNQEFNCLNV